MKATPAALAAFARGDMDNFLTASTPGGIEAQEKAGQTTFVANSQLPKECPRKELEAMGFKFGADVDNLFVSVTMPAGWKKQATEHSMWSELVDDKGRKRAGIFYKAAFYDRSAHMGLDRRYGISCYEKAGEGMDAVTITDCGKEIHRLGTYKERDYPALDVLEKKAKDWLNEKFPKWQDATAYWD
jgi:hypothetical protein